LSPCRAQKGSTVLSGPSNPSLALRVPTATFRASLTLKAVLLAILVNSVQRKTSQLSKGIAMTDTYASRGLKGLNLMIKSLELSAHRVVTVPWAQLR
jgi:hypothetical protein